MKVALVLISDRGDLYRPHCIASLQRHVDYPFDHWFIVDDSDHSRGLAGSVRSGWAAAQGYDYLFHVEEDFVFTADIDIAAMIDVLERTANLAQVVLKRQAWSPVELSAGGIIECHPSDYVDRDGWVEHQRIFSLNPCVVPARVFDRGWPDDNEAEMTRSLVDDGYVFGFWGGRTDAPRCLHIGDQRGSGWKL